MKANELMIDDWVTVIADDKLFPSKYVGKSIPCKVEGFSYEPIVQPSYTEKGIGIDLIPQIGLMVRVANNFGYMYFEAEKLSPIPLTPEILEKNGWKHEFDKADYMVKYDLGEEGKNCWMMWAIKEHNLDIQRQDENLDVYNLKVSKIVIPCDYVHQLQHAMRICGINKEIER